MDQVDERDVFSSKDRHQKQSFIKCIVCNVFFNTTNLLINHLETCHNIAFDYEEKSFNSKQDFDAWKSSFENDNCIGFTKRKETATHIYYYCNRTPFNRRHIRDANVAYKRQPKSQGSCKSENACTSYMKVDKSDGKFDVLLQKTHYGHQEELQHVPLPKSIRQDIARKLMSGVSRKRVLQSFADDINMEQPTRKDLVTAQDVKNIVTSPLLSAQHGVYHKNDAISVSLRVQQCSDSEENPFIFMKQQGSPCDGFSVDDFCLVYVNQDQVKMIQTFGGDIIAIDGTHGLNGYDFELVTLLVVDEFKIGFPVGFMFTNRKDTAIYSHFFRCIKNVVGEITPHTFMSDMELAFYNAWKEVMGPSPETLWCAWHVDRAWQRNLAKINNRQKRNEVYKLLKILQQETILEDFPVSLSNFMTFLISDDETKRFGEYFSSYVSEAKKWAYCFRSGGVHTNMHLESMHKVIKYFYCERKTVRRLDKGLQKVLEYLQTKTADRFVNSSKGKVTPENRKNFKRHNEALGMRGYSIVGNEYGSYIVKSNKNQYKVDKVNVSITHSCQNLCSSCKICVHSYVCECPDYKRNKLICKHIHFIVHSREVEVIESEPLIFTTRSSPPKDPHKKAVKHTETCLAKLLEDVKSIDWAKMDTEMVKSLGRTFATASASIHATKTIAADFAPSQNTKKLKIDPQLRFTSKKKKRALKPKTLERPSKNEVLSLRNVLKGNLFISNLILDEHNYSLK